MNTTRVQHEYTNKTKEYKHVIQTRNTKGIQTEYKRNTTGILKEYKTLIQKRNTTGIQHGMQKKEYKQ